MQFQLSDKEINYFRRIIVKWGRKNFARFPWRFTPNKWHALVAEIMLQRTNADQVLPTYIEFCEKYPEPAEFVKVSNPRVFQHLGLHWREKYLSLLATILTNKAIPDTKSELKKLPGIGDYVAAAYLSMHLNLRATIVDSNVVRLYGRYFGFDTDGETRRKKWLRELAETLTPRRTYRDFNYALVDFTRSICLPKPRCPDCPLRRKCRFANRLN